MLTDSIQFYTIHVHMLLNITDYRTKYVCGAGQNESFNTIQVNHQFGTDNMDCNNVRTGVGNSIHFSTHYNCTLHHKPVVY